MVKNSTDTGRAIAGGAMAGASAGFGLTVLMTALAGAANRDIWYGMKGAAAPFLGERAMQPGFDFPAVVLGLMSHFAISLIWGVLFALAFYGLSRTTIMLAGIGWGFVVWIGMYYVVLPTVGLSHMADEAPVGRAISFHVFYSVVMAAIYLVVRHALSGERIHIRHIGPHAHV